jgi:NAD(P)-dependent dehydrogenase (short-subunit alcohol dehydrogenase family)
MNQKTNKAAIVTGASRGIGAAVAERLGSPADIAAAVSFLAGPDAGWINGQTLRANGGII